MTAPTITSTANPRVRAWRALGDRRERDRSGTFLVEGVREVERVAGLASVAERIWCPDLAGSPPAGVTLVSKHVFGALSRRQHPDGVAAVVRTPPLDLSTFDPGTDTVVLIADGIQKPGNIGAMLRTVDALGAAFVGADLATDLVNPNVIRSAQGSLFGTPTAAVTRTDAVQWAVNHGVVVVLRPDDAVNFWDVDLTDPTSIVIGSEATGAGAAWDGVGIGARIPTVGTADSLNASVTAGIALAEARRQRSR